MINVQPFITEWRTKRVADPSLAGDGLPPAQWYQCVSLIKEYLREDFGLAAGTWGNAIDYWTHTNPALLAKFDRIATQDVQEGDIVILVGLPGNTAGHIVIATGGENATQFEGLEQNGATGKGTGLGNDAIRTRWIAKSRIAGVLRPKVAAPAPKPAPATAPHTTSTAPATPSDRYTVVTPIHGYYTSNEAANHIQTEHTITVAPGEYHVFNSAHGMVNVTTVVGQSYAWINPADNIQIVPAPEPAPAAATATATATATAAESAPPKPANTTYTKLAEPMQLVTNKQPTHLWDLGFHDDAHATSVSTVDAGTPFVAYGRAQRTDYDKPAYFMTEADFGNADVDGTPVHNQGINTVDLSPAPTPTPASEAEAEAEAPKNVDIKVVDNSGMPDPNPDPAEPTEPTEPAAPTATIPTKPAVPEGVVFTAFMSPQQYKVIEDVTVEDLAGELPAMRATKGMTFKKGIGGKMLAGGYWYYRTQVGVENGTYYAFPVDKLRKLTKDDTPDEAQSLDESATAAAQANDADIDQLGAEISQEMEHDKNQPGTLTLTAAHDQAIKTVATAEGLMIRFLRFVHLIK